MEFQGKVLKINAKEKRIKCKFCDFSVTLTPATNKENQEEDGVQALLWHVVKNHEEEAKKFMEYEGDILIPSEHR